MSSSDKGSQALLAQIRLDNRLEKADLEGMERARCDECGSDRFIIFVPTNLIDASAPRECLQCGALRGGLRLEPGPSGDIPT